MSAEYDTTLLADKIFTNSTLLRQHTENQRLCFIEFSKAYYLVIQLYFQYNLLFVNNDTVVNSVPPHTNLVYVCTGAALRGVINELCGPPVG
jgi:hypothetical protein